MKERDVDPTAKEPPKNRAVRARKAAVKAPQDPFASEDSPPPGPVSQSVRPPAPNTKKPKSRFFSTIQLLAGVLVVLSASVAVAWGARRYVTTSHRFAVRSVTVDGTQRRTAEEVATLAGVSIGKNIFSVDPARAEAGILADPWIEKAKVVRSLPGTVEIVVAEREAVALCTIGGELYLVTRDGDLFKKAEGDDPTDLPVITGVLPEQVAKDRAGVVLANKRVLDVAEDLNKVGIARRYPIQEMHTNTDGSLVVTIGKEAILLHFGQPPYRDKIEQAARVLNEVARRKASASVVFLDNNAHPERVVVRMK
ncbi:MAG: FtsQ-type POTRA domain-containing protein [Polyangiaceae bacterium]